MEAQQITKINNKKGRIYEGNRNWDRGLSWVLFIRTVLRLGVVLFLNSAATIAAGGTTALLEVRFGQGVSWWPWGNPPRNLQPRRTRKNFQYWHYRSQYPRWNNFHYYLFYFRPFHSYDYYLLFVHTYFVSSSIAIVTYFFASTCFVYTGIIIRRDDTRGACYLRGSLFREGGGG